MSTPETTVRIVHRLRAADTLLAGEGLHVPTFAAGHSISGKTVGRLLASLTDLGCHHVVTHEDGRHVHRYAPGVRRLFASATVGRPGIAQETRDAINAAIGPLSVVRASDARRIATECGASYGTVMAAAKAAGKTKGAAGG